MASIDFCRGGALDFCKRNSRKGKPIDGYTRAMIYHIYSRLQKNNPKETVSESLLNTSLCVGVSERTVARILQEKRENGCFRTPGKIRPNLRGKRIRLVKYEQSALTALRAKINSYFHENENPSVKGLLTEINNDKSILKTTISRTTFHRLTIDMGIRFKKIKNRVILLQSTDQEQSPKLGESENNDIVLQSTDQEQSLELDESENNVIVLQSTDQEQSPKLDDSEKSVIVLQSTDKLHQEQLSKLSETVMDSSKMDEFSNVTIPHDLFEGSFRPGKPINGHTREMIYNIYSRFKNSNPNENITDIIKKTSVYVGVSVRTVGKILQEKRQNGCFQTPGLTRPNSRGKRIRLVRYGQSVLDALRSKVNTYFMENKKPSVKGLLIEINKDKGIFKSAISRSTFNRLMRDMGIRFQKIKNRVIMLQIADQSDQEQLPKLEKSDQLPMLEKSETHVIMPNPENINFYSMP